MTKNELRQQLKEKRRGIATSDHTEKSKKIGALLENLNEYKDAQRVLFYVSRPEEVNTHELIKDALSAGKNVFVPKTVKDVVVICPLYDFEELELGEYGILEPCTSTETEELIRMDLIVIPGVGFDLQGHRLGHGKGHYDRLLKETRGYKVGLAFEEQLVPELPHEEHDVPVDALITDKKILKFTH